MPHTPERPASQAASRPAEQPAQPARTEGGPKTPKKVTRGRTGRPWESAYLAILSKHGQKTKAAKAAKVDPSTVCDRRNIDPEFAQDERRAMKAAAASWESEAVRRGVDGVITQTRFHPITGKKIGETRTFSDTILLRLLVKGETGSWRDSAKVEFAGSVDFTQMTRAQRVAKLEEARKAGKAPL